jgi:hypothetical protein
MASVVALVGYVTVITPFISWLELTLKAVCIWSTAGANKALQMSGSKPSVI